MTKLFQTGLLPQREGDDRFDISWAHEHLGIDLAAPLVYPIDTTQGQAGNITWLMLGNGPDRTLTVHKGVPVGDCFFAAEAHERILAIVLGKLPSSETPTADQTVTLYLRYDKGQDVGVVLADALLWLYQNGYILGFAPVHPDTVDAVMAKTGRPVLVGVNLTDDAQDLTMSGSTWTVSNGETPDPEEGHCILRITAINAQGASEYVTWGQIQAADAGWCQACVTESWIILSAEDKQQMGSAWDGLVAQLDALPQAVGPGAASPPPAPSVSSAPDGVLHAIADLLHWIADHI